MNSIYILIAVTILLLLWLMWLQNPVPVEGFNPISKAKNAVKKANKATKRAKQASQGISSIRREMDQLPSIVEEQVVQQLNKRLQRFFTSFQDVLYVGLVNPIVVLFTGFGSIFELIVAALEQIIQKIISLPYCIFFYIIDGVIRGIFGIIRWVFSMIYLSIINRFFVNPIEDGLFFLLGLFGYNELRRTCVGFNVKDDVNKMKANMDEIRVVFERDFGKLDFNRVAF